jgi:protein-S-isoprenylcysteine O-methyltransferase Ste14
MPANTPPAHKNRRPLRTIVGGILSFILIVALIFVIAGRITYWQAWVYGALNLFFLLLTAVSFVGQPEFVRERTNFGPGMKGWDKIYFAVSTPMYFAAIVIAALDAGRYGWTAKLPASVYIVSIILYVLGQSIFLWAKRANRFFAGVVRIQSERGHTVCQDGPYRFVRHPGYVGGILYMMTTPLVLGSLWALIPQGVAVISLIVRTYLEDLALQKELPGYIDYTKKVRYRLLPGIW